MTLRLASVLMFVGWYLMIAPLSHSELDEDAPLSKWKLLDNFNSASECKRAYDADFDYRKLKQRSPTAPEIWLLAVAGVHCIASDDPRLKGN